MASDIATFYRRLRRLGWRIERNRRGGHVSLTPPPPFADRARPATGSVTPSDPRSLLNLRRDLRRTFGEDVPLPE